MILFIPLCNFTSWEHNELRLALRSWSQYANIEKVLIIGHKPDWLTNVEHIPYDDSRRPKIENIFNKVKIAAEHYPEFIFGNDDHYLLNPLTELPYYYSTKLKDFKGSAGDTFYRYVSETARLFPEGNYYDIHVPMICKREIINKLEYKKDILFKSYYCNTAGVKGKQLADCNIRGHIRRDQIENYVKGRDFVSTTDGIATELKKYLLERFRIKSKFEV